MSTRRALRSATLKTLMGCALMLAPGARCAHAGNDIINSNNQVGIQFVDTHFAYKEKDDFGAPLDSESGWVPGIGVSASLMKNWFVENFYLQAQFSWSDGKTAYKGAYIDGGGYGSVVAKDGATVKDFDFRVGKGFELRRDAMLTPFFGIGWHDWDRKVNAGEDYSNGYYGAGLLFQYSPLSRMVLSVDGLVGRTFDSQISIASIPDAGIVGSSLSLGQATTYKLGVSDDYALTRSIHVNAGFEWTKFDYGKSSPDPTDTYYEPDSRTSNVTVRVGAGYSFGDGQ